MVCDPPMTSSVTIQYCKDWVGPQLFTIKSNGFSEKNKCDLSKRGGTGNTGET